MDNVAVFVDAGYLFAQGSVALCGRREGRSNLVLNASRVVEALKALASERAPSCRLLRIYWYDGAASSHPTAEQALLAHLDDVKLRLGFINTAGQQKGVDSLIVTDLIELARQKSICDAVLLSGDEMCGSACRSRKITASGFTCLGSRQAEGLNPSNSCKRPIRRSNGTGQS